MQISHLPVERWLLFPCALLLLALAACGGSQANATPTMSVESIYTAAIETFQAQQATQFALTPPTETPAPTASATLPPLSPFPTISVILPTSAGGSSLCDNAAYVADLTIPDGTVMTPGQSFQKKWRLQNTGTCTWSTSYELAFSSGSLMGGAPSFIKVPVPPGNQADMAVNLAAPTTAGSYTGTWRMQNAAGQAFGNFITVVITVGSSSTVTPGPSPTPGSGTLTISGNAGAASATLTYSGTTSGTVTADDSGAYSISVPSGWTGSITPSKGKTGKWVFSPASQSFSNVTSNQSFDFTASEATASPAATSTP